MPQYSEEIKKPGAAGEFYSPRDDYVPFDHAPASFPRQFLDNPFLHDAKRPSDLGPLDPRQPLIIDEDISAPRATFIRASSKGGPGGDSAELLPNLLACIKVGNLDRAVTLVRRLNQLYVKTAPEVRHAHHLYIKALVDALLRDQPGSGITIKDIQRWFEVEVRSQGVPVDALTYSLLIKAGFCALEGPKLDRTIRRYLELARWYGVDVQEEVLAWEHWTDNEWDHLMKIVSSEHGLSSTNLAQASELQDPTTVLPDQVDVPLPEVKPVEQKGQGLQALKNSLSVFTSTSDVQDIPDTAAGRERNDQTLARVRQTRLEQDSLDSAINRWREENEAILQMGISGALQKKSIGALMWQWHCALTPLIQEELARIKNLEAKESPTDSDSETLRFAPYLALLSPEKTAAVAITSILSELSFGGVASGIKTAHLVVSVGKALEEESALESLKKSGLTDSWGRHVSAHRQRKLAKLLKRPRTRKANSAVSDADQNTEALTDQATTLHWSATARVKCGALVLVKLMEAARMNVYRTDPKTSKTITEEQPAFYHTYHMEKGKRYGDVRANDELITILKKEPPRFSIVKHLPMVAEPRPWSNFDEGGFLVYPISVVRIKASSDAGQRRYAVTAARRGDLAQVFAGLDVLSKTPWRINRDLFGVMLQIWNSGQAAGKIVPEQPDLPYPPQPAASEDPSARWKWVLKLKIFENERMGLHSQRCFQNLQLEVARSYLNETFYFPHNVDFRGRAYPLPPYLNHMGADNARALLRFAKGKELGNSGLRWLKIHLANVFGYDKASLKDREEFANEHLTDIYDSATNPVNGQRWWLKGEDPWQCLATCFELKNALDYPDPTRFVSHLPIHQDGSCNGLQHYAALGGDSLGARQVNLEPGDKPADVYTAVAELVKEEIKRDAAQGNPMAKMLEGKVTRKVVKTTVMTNVYGVTFIGAKAQVYDKLKEIMPNVPDTPTLNLNALSMYVARGIFKALSAMFKGAHDIQYWLGECANRICTSVTPQAVDQFEKEHAGIVPKSASNLRRWSRTPKVKPRGLPPFRSTVIWTTPLKMPVVQHYRKPKTTSIVTHLQRVTIQESRPFDPVSKRKQLQAFPPNFIHSLDATHMLLSALKCNEAGLTFAAVHDSFWTHAADIPVMNHILRDAFVRMHSEDIIGRLAAEFAARYKGCIYEASVYKNSPVGKNIEAHRAGRKHSGDRTAAELLEERQRQRLLASSDAVERQKGLDMVTPASILEAADDPSALLLPDGVKASALGAVPSDTRKEVAEEHADDGLDAEFAEEAEIEAGSTDDMDVAADHEEDSHRTQYSNTMKVMEERRKSVAGLPHKKKIHLWLPLTFPPVPKKGDFDVSRLKDSQYFFS